MRYDKEQIISDLNLKPFGSQGWMTNKDMNCPFCGKSGKWGIIFNDTGVATFHCWKCPRKTSLFEFLKKIGRVDLAKKTYSVKPNELLLCPKLESNNDYKPEWATTDEVVKEEDLKPVSLPLRMKPLVNDAYLDSRGFKEEHYREYEPSYTNSPLEPKLKNFIIFKMKIDGVCVAWWARSRYSKEWHKENLELYKQHKADLVLRYRNSENNFQNLLGGYDKIIEGKTDTVILVEGIFDSVNIDNLLDLYHFDEVKCCFTFGNNIGQGQIDSLRRKKVKNIILLYDYGTINESKEAALKMRDIFEDVQVATIKTPGIDPGNITIEELDSVLREATDPINFFYNKIGLKL